MKKIFFIFFIILVIWSCSKKITPAKTEITQQADATTEATRSIDIKPVVSAEVIAAGKTTFEAKCGRCHALKNPGDYTAVQWVQLVGVMAPKALLTDTEKNNVLAYVQSGAKL